MFLKKIQTLIPCSLGKRLRFRLFMYQGHCLTGTSCGHSRDESRGYRSLFNKGAHETNELHHSF